MKKIAVFFLLVITLSFVLTVTSALAETNKKSPLTKLGQIGDVRIYHHDGALLISKVELYQTSYGSIDAYVLGQYSYFRIEIAALILIIIVAFVVGYYLDKYEKAKKQNKDK